MLTRIWMSIAALWAVLISWLIFREPDNIQTGPLIVAYAPLFAPIFLRWFTRFVFTGELRRRPPVMVYRTHR